ncbi:MAG: SDR family NAD(P)-dependent oxidoreductase [Halieaceae bacterium]|nr:SDR family NAD(P)-dependent oxidoreductase [Halieaceae bacterium]
MKSTAFEQFDLSGKSAFVTGGGTGIGYNVSHALLKSGARVMIAARREEVLADAARRLMESVEGGEVYCTRLDLSDRNSVEEVADHATSRLGGVDIFVANAGKDVITPVDKVDYGDIDAMYQVNVASNMRLVTAFLPYMRKNQWGRIIFISSILAKLASTREHLGLYCSAKAALNSYARSVAAESGRDGITVNNINPGLHHTAMLQEFIDASVEAHGPQFADEFVNSINSQTILGRMGRTDEIEGVIQLLASEAGSYITGTDITLDGGMSILLKPNPL